MFAHYKEFLYLLGIIITFLIGFRARKISNRKEEAIARQEEVKIKKPREKMPRRAFFTRPNAPSK